MRPEVGSRTYWGWVAGYVMAVFAVQPFLGFAVDAVKDRWGEGVLEAIGYAGAGLGALLILWGSSRVWAAARPAERLLIVAGVLAYGAGSLSMTIPQERLHYLEYGILAGLLFVGFRGAARASAGRRRGIWRAAVLAVLVGIGIGLADELLQIAWPRRYFDWRDVRLNGLAVLLGSLVTAPAWEAWVRGRKG